MPTVHADRLSKIGSVLLRAAGASPDEAQAVAVGCVNANLAGHDSHGIIVVPTYIDRIKAGHIVPGASFTIVQETPTTTVVGVLMVPRSERQSGRGLCGSCSPIHCAPEPAHVYFDPAIF